MPIGYSGVSTAVIEGSLTTWSASISLQEQSAHIITVVTDNITTVNGFSNTHTQVRPDNRLAGTAIKLNEYTNTNGVVGDGVTTSWWYLPTVTGDGGLVQITASFSGNAGDAIMTAVGISVPEGKIVEVERAGIAPDLTSTSFSGLPLREYFILGIFTAEGEDTAKTPDPDYIEIFDVVSSTAGAANVNIQALGQYRIATLTGDTISVADTTFTNGTSTYIALFESDGPTTQLTAPANGVVNQSLTPTLSFIPTQSSFFESGLNSALVISRGDITSPVSLRNSLAFGNVDAMEIVIEGSNLFAFGTTSWNWYQVTPTSFNSLGSGTTPQSSSNFFGITYLSGTVAGGNLRIAHANPRIGTTLATLGTYQFNGTSFVQVGSLLSFGSTSDSSNLTVTRLTDTRVAVLRSLASGGYELRAYDFNGTNWSAVGSLINLGFSGPSSIASLDSSSIVIVNAWSWSIMSYSFNGTFWSQQSRRQTFSNTTAVSNVRAVDVQVMSPNRIALSNSYEGRLEIWRLIDSQYWALESRLTGISALDLNTSTAIGVINETDIVYYSNAIDTFRVYVASQITLIAEADNGGGFSTTAPLSSGVSYNYNVPAGSLQASTQYFWTLLTYGFTDVSWGTHAVGKYAVPRSFTTLSQGVDPLEILDLMPDVTVVARRNAVFTATQLTGTLLLLDDTVVIPKVVQATPLQAILAINDAIVATQVNGIALATPLTVSLAIQDVVVVAIRNVAVSATQLAVSATLQNVTVSASTNVSVSATPLTVTLSLQNVTNTQGVGDTVVVDSSSAIVSIENVTVATITSISVPATVLTAVLAINNATISLGIGDLVSVDPLASSFTIQNVVVSVVKNNSFLADALTSSFSLPQAVVQIGQSDTVIPSALTMVASLQNATAQTTSSDLVVVDSLALSATLQAVTIFTTKSHIVAPDHFQLIVLSENVSVATTRTVLFQASPLTLSAQIQNAGVSTAGSDIVPVSQLTATYQIQAVTVSAQRNLSISVTQSAVVSEVQVADVIEGTGILLQPQPLQVSLQLPQATLIYSRVVSVGQLTCSVQIPTATASSPRVVQVTPLQTTLTLLSVTVDSETSVFIDVDPITGLLQINTANVDFGKVVQVGTLQSVYSMLPVLVRRTYVNLGLYKSAIRNVNETSEIKDINHNSRIPFEIRNK